MPKLPPLTSRQLITILKNRGFLLDHITGSHYVFYHPAKQRRVTVPYHSRDIAKGTLLSILKQAGIGKDELE